MIATARNKSDKDMTAEVEYTGEDPQWGKIRFRRPLWLPARSQAVVWLAGRPGLLPAAPAEAGEKRKRSPQEVLLHDRDTGQQVDRRSTVALLPVGKSEKLICFVDESRDPSPYSYLNSKVDKYLSNPVACGLTGMPDHWYGYSPVSMLLVGYVDVARHRPSQLQAILDWVSQGGVLVLFATERSDELLGTVLGAAAQVTVAETRWMRTLSVASTHGRPNKTIQLDRATRYLNVTNEGAEVLYTANGLPLLTRARYGMGFVHVLAVPVGALSHPDLMAIWRVVQVSLLTMPAVQIHTPARLRREDRASAERKTESTARPGRAKRAKGRSRPETRIFHKASFEKLQDIAGRRGLDGGVVLGCLVAFAAVTAGVGVLMHLRRRGERTWLVMLPTGMILALAMYVYAERQKDTPAVSYVGVAIGDGQGRATVHQAFSYYSPSEVPGLAVAPGSPLGHVFPLNPYATKGLGLTTAVTGNGVGLANVRIAENSAPAFLAEAVTAWPGFAADLRFAAAGMEGSITNQTGRDVTDAILLIRGRAYRIGDLPTGKATAVTIGLSQRMQAGEFVPKAYKGLQDRRNNDMIAQLTANAGKQGPRDDRPYVLGWSADRLLGPGPAMEKVAADGMMLLAQPIAIGRSPAGTTVRIPPEMTVQRYGRLGRVAWSQPSGFVEFVDGGAIEVIVGPPPEVGRLEDITATLSVEVTAPTYRLTIEGAGAAGEAELLASRKHPSGTTSIRVADADRFRNQQGKLRFRLRVSAIAGEAKDRDVTKVRKWKFQAIETILQGTVR